MASEAVVADGAPGARRQRLRYFLASAFWQSAATVLARGTVVLAVLFMARRLPVAEFGEVSTVRSTVTLLATVAAAGTGIVASKFLGRWLATELQRCHGLVGFAVGFAALAGVMLSAGFLIAAPWFAVVLNNPTLDTALRIAAALVFAEALTSVIIGTLIGLGETRRFAFASAIGVLPYLPIVFVTTTAGTLVSALTGLVLAEIVLLFVRATALWQALRRHGIRPRWTFGIAERAMLSSTALPALLNGIAAVPFLWVGVLLLVRTDGGYNEMALYGAAMPWFALLLFIPNQVAAVFLPALAQGFGARDIAALRADLGVGLKMVSAAVLPAIPVMLLAPWILSFYGEAYAAAVPVLTLVAAAAIAAAAQNLLTNVLAATDRLWISVGFSLVWCAVYVATAGLLIGRGWGAEALATALLAAYSVKLVLFAAYGWRRRDVVTVH